ncbi:peptidylprolyl isomerase [Thioalkalivibrio denitrificans]|uniref:Periplasmic chaperone PpiD n=1 Tax=Thioalkalivibrio denitrificans TaxID=108003 RepID=A0A1V3NUJ4_9GAMM|nr:SurA N-terminal domain-containing protein [Thioalkalivibrio denitrificans]OOG28701.1 peptidylprolyl isomerase [Thioalkalivibrio denitrificans]
MLQKIRDKATGWIAYAIIILISIPFALWGLNEYFGGAPARVVAEVNGVEITQRQFQQEYQNQRQQLAAMFGGRIPSGAVDDAVLRDNALQSLIRRELVAQMADKKGFRVSDSAVAAEIRGIPGFQRAGEFDPERYRQVLDAQRRTPAQFESLIKQALLLEQFQRGYQEAAFMPGPMLEDYLRLRNERRSVSLHTIPAEAFVDEIQVDDEQVAEYYEEHADRYRTPERIRLAYLMLDEETLRGEVSVTEEDLRREYEQRVDRFTEPEERRARHILIRVPDDADADAVASAEARARETRQRLDDGEDFADLAAEVSDDPLAATGGGDLGFIARGDIDPDLEAVLFTLREGDISHPVRTRQGFQIVKLTEIRPPVRTPFAEVRDEVEAEYRNRRIERLQIELTERLLTESYEQPGSLEPAADATGLEIRHTDWFARDEPSEGLAAEPAVQRALASEDVRAGRNSDLIDLPDGRVAVIRIAEREPAAARPLEDVADEIRLQLVWEGARARAEEAGTRAMERLRAGESFADVVAELPGASMEETWVTRDSAEVSSRVLHRIFTMARPVDGTPLVGGLAVEGGDYAVFVQHGWEPGEVDPARRAEVAGQLTGLYGGLEFEALYQALEAEAKIRIHGENL